MSGNHIYTVNIGGTNNKALGDLQVALYNLLEGRKDED